MGLLLLALACLSGLQLVAAQDFGECYVQGTMCKRV